MAVTDPIPVAVLAGERPGGSPLALHFQQRSSVLVALAGATPLEWALRALVHSQRVHAGWLLGPDRALLAEHPAATRAMAKLALQWRRPEHGPAASLLALRQSIGSQRLLVTTADHALLTPEIVDHFVAIGAQNDADLVVALVPHALVAQAWPTSQRTRLRLAGGPYCGANLFLLNHAAADRALALWQAFEAERKHPWRLARRLGLRTLARYLSGRLSLAAAATRFSELSGARVALVELPFARAAVDVDSVADWQLAEAILKPTGSTPS